MVIAVQEYPYFESAGRRLVAAYYIHSCPVCRLTFRSAAVDVAVATDIFAVVAPALQLSMVCAGSCCTDCDSPFGRIDWECWYERATFLDIDQEIANCPWSRRVIEQEKMHHL